jgi:hypothetical protein
MFSFKNSLMLTNTCIRETMNEDRLSALEAHADDARSAHASMRSVLVTGN